MAQVKTQVKIRPMEPEDITDILEIDRKVRGKNRAVTYQDLMSGNLGGELNLSFVAEIEGRVRGIILARYMYGGIPVTAGCLIQVLGVDPDYQGQGIASKLVDAVLEQSKSKGLKWVHIAVAEKDSALQSFFNRKGFRRSQIVDYEKSL
jgi:ribosomal protein S18 acetylase RimI-like enzyme